LLAANRDEFHQRPTCPSGFWPDHPMLLAGRDEQLGGTWMGITRDGRFAAVTNFRDPAATALAPRSRGELPLDYLLGELQPGVYLQEVREQATQYAGFSLLVGNRQSLWYLNNSSVQPGHGSDNPRELPPGIYGLSNAHLDTPWPKVVTGKQRLQGLIGNSQTVSHDTLREVVSDAALADPAELESLGMGTDMEQILSAQFIQSETYGTRSTTTLWCDSAGETSWRELSYDSRGRTADRKISAEINRPDWG
jgi:uncharacterized protein with NRDE domain